jgi:imidazolonepropionase
VIPADFLIYNSSELFTCAGPAPRRGAAQADARVISRGVVAAFEGRIVFVGFESLLKAEVEVLPHATRIDAEGGAILPGFVDPHTHAIFAGDRREELRRRMAGATYAEIAAEGGGILSTVVATRAASEETLLRETRARLDEMLSCGTTTCEVKSGYGLDAQSELKLLRVVAQLAREHPIEISPTFMGAHEIPAEYRGRPDDYVDAVIGDMLPVVVRDRLAEWCDVFCERGVFTPKQSRKILEAAKESGLKPRIHADELARSGGASVAVQVGARSADHLIFADEEDADALASADVVATLLPTAAFYLKLPRFAPARMLIERRVPVALATDVNPGGGFSPSMPFAMTLACFAMGLTFEEALVAATINAAYALDRADRLGSLQPGKQLDAVIVAGRGVDLIRVGAHVIRVVVKNGRVVVPSGNAYAH